MGPLGRAPVEEASCGPFREGPSRRGKLGALLGGPQRTPHTPIMVPTVPPPSRTLGPQGPNRRSKLWALGRAPLHAKMIRGIVELVPGIPERPQRSLVLQSWSLVFPRGPNRRGKLWAP